LQDAFSLEQLARQASDEASATRALNLAAMPASATAVPTSAIKKTAVSVSFITNSARQQYSTNDKNELTLSARYPRVEKPTPSVITNSSIKRSRIHSHQSARRKYLSYF
jgi:hypothetical protein